MIQNQSVVEKGGAGSGNFAHAGRPGKIGGSATSITYYTGHIRGLPDRLTNVKPEYKQFIEDVFRDIKKSVPSIPDDLNYYVGRSPLFITKQNEVYGNMTKTEDGKSLIIVDMDLMEQKVAKAGVLDKANLKDWFAIGHFDADSLKKHVISHEIGHVWWYTHSEKSKELLPIPGGKGSKGLIELNSMLNEWRDKIWPTYKSTMSGYSRYLNSHSEAFADAFSQFVMGESMNPDVEQWFMDNVK